jgi:hypothetical protein
MDSGAQLKITITGVDKASKVFDAVVDSAEKLGPELDQATASAKKLGPAMDEMADATERSADSIKQQQEAIKETAAGVALLGTAFTVYAGQQREHQVTVAALERIYGEAADSYIAFADSVQNNTIFSNDEALEAARIMGTLRENYDLTDAQIQQLITTSADLATMHGLTLSDAAQRVTAAIRGEAESAEALGLTMNQAAIDSQGLTLTMTNGEAAAFRFDALMEQSASSVGAAGDAAETTAGKTQQLANRFQDAVMGAVAFTGPVGEVAASLSAFGLEAGVAVGGLASLAKGLHGLKAAGALAGLATFLTGPAGIVIGLGAAATAAWLLVDSIGESGLSGSFDRAETTVADLTEEVQRLTAGLTDAQLALDIFEAQSTFQPMIDDITRLNQLWGDFTNPTRGQQGGVQWTAELEAEMDALIAQFGPSADAALGEVEAAMADWSAIISHNGAGAKASLEAAAEAFNTFEASAQTPEDFDALVAALDTIANGLDEADRAALEAAAANQTYTESVTNSTTALNEHAQAQISANAELAQWMELHGLVAEAPPLVSNAQIDWLSKYAEQLDYALLAVEELAAAHVKLEKETVDLTSTTEQATRATADWGTELDQLTSGKAQEIEAVAAAYQELAEAIGMPLNPQEALGAGFGAIVGGAQGFGQLAQQTADWSASLAHAAEDSADGLTELDRLYADGQITLTTYNAALEANHRIQQANNDVQEDSLRIQAKQLPIMADMAEAQAEYVDSIADMPAAQQAAALGFMDTAKSAQALELAQLAAASGSAAMQESTTAMIATIAASDPVMKEMLISMGLISEGADGTITVNFGDSHEQT